MLVRVTKLHTVYMYILETIWNLDWYVHVYTETYEAKLMASKIELQDSDGIVGPKMDYKASPSL